MDDGAKNGLIGALISTFCYIIPLLFLIIGVGSLALAASMGAYKNYFILAGTAFVTFSIANRLRMKARRCPCSYKQLIRGEARFIATALITFIAVLGIINFAVIPYVANVVSEKPDVTKLNTSVNSAPELRELRLKIDGITCESCVVVIKESLMQVRGVVDVSYVKGEAVVIYNPALISPQEIVRKIPHSARIISDRRVQSS